MPRFIITSPGFGNQACDLPDGTVTVGRDRRNMIIIEDDSVSARHCEILVQRREVIVRELGSHNGTFVNGVRVKAQCGVNNAQSLRLGAVVARIVIESPEANDATAITAMDAYRNSLMGHGEAPLNPTTFPIVFAPLKADPDESV